MHLGKKNVGAVVKVSGAKTKFPSELTAEHLTNCQQKQKRKSLKEQPLYLTITLVMSHQSVSNESGSVNNKDNLTTFAFFSAGDIL